MTFDVSPCPVLLWDPSHLCYLEDKNDVSHDHCTLKPCDVNTRALKCCYCEDSLELSTCATIKGCRGEAATGWWGPPAHGRTHRYKTTVPSAVSDASPLLFGQQLDALCLQTALRTLLSDERELRFLIVLLTQVETVQDELLRRSGPAGICVFLFWFFRNKRQRGRN